MYFQGTQINMCHYVLSPFDLVPAHNRKTAPLDVGFSIKSWPRGYKLFVMLNAIEHEMFPAHKC